MMDGGDFWPVGRSGGGHERMFRHSAAGLRFRPIAPKPAVGGAFSGGISPETAASSSTAEKRVKRKYVRARRHDNSPRRKRSNRKGSNSVELKAAGESPGNSSGSRSRAEEGVVESLVTVDRVTDTCMERAAGLSGCTDAERVRSLEADACPGFVSDGSLSKVEWVNEAYRRMVAESHGGGGRPPPQVAVRLVSRSTDSGTQSQLGGCTDGALFFTCHVRVQYCVNNSNNNNNKEKMCWKVMPCDVWRLDSGGFAWKLDIKAALSLGL